MAQSTKYAFYISVIAVAVLIFQPEPMRTIIAALVALLGIIVLNIFSMSRVSHVRKAVFITGCDSGFGFDLAVKLDEIGYMVFAGCLKHHHQGADALKGKTSKRLHIVKIDVTDDVQVEEALKYVTEHLKDHVLWAVVNNAGISVCTEIEWCSVAQFQRVMDVNVFGVVRVTKVFLPLLRQSKGRVINMASLGGRFTLAAFSAYSMSKKACIAFSDGLRLEMAKFDVKVITIEPGLYRTPISESQRYVDLNKTSWEDMPDSVRNDYGEEYFKSFLEEVILTMAGARTNTDEVVNIMVQAVICANPYKRYVPYWLADLRAHILMSLPSAITDHLFSSAVAVEVEMKRRESMQSVELN